MIGRGLVPIGGGGCTPTVHLMERNGPNENDEAPIGVVEGPMCFGGCYDLCCNTSFKISRTKGSTGYIGKITKLNPQYCGYMSKQTCSTADTYVMDITPGSPTLNPLQKVCWSVSDSPRLHVFRHGSAALQGRTERKRLNAQFCYALCTALAACVRANFLSLLRISQVTSSPGREGSPFAHAGRYDLYAAYVR